MFPPGLPPHDPVHPSPPYYSTFTPPASPQNSRTFNLAPRPPISLPPTPPSSSFLQFDISAPSTTRLQTSQIQPAQSQDFNRIVGSPPRVNAVDSTSPTFEPSSPSEGQRRAHRWNWKPSPTSTSDVFTEPVSNFYLGGRQTAPQALATRYLRVDGLDRSATNADLFALFRSMQGIKGCATKPLASQGAVVLAFWDVRDALTAQRTLGAYPTRCIDRLELHRLSTLENNQLISISEGVIAVVLRGPLTSFAQLQSLLTSFGPLRTWRQIDPHSFVIEYWNDLHAEKAALTLHTRLTNDLKMFVSYEPQLATTTLHFSPPSPPVQFMDGMFPSNGLHPHAPIFLPNSQEDQRTTTARSKLSPLLPVFVPPQQDHSKMSATPSYAPTVPKRTPLGSIGNSLGGKGYQGEKNGNKPIPPQVLLPVVPSFPPGLPVPVKAPENLPQPSTSSSKGPYPAAERPQNDVARGWGTYRENDRIPTKNLINLDRVKAGLDLRTTLMLKNIPNRAEASDVMKFVEEAVGKNAFDFFYLRIDFNSKSNVGYAFINFTSTAALVKFYEVRFATRYDLFASAKICYFTYAETQGKDALIAKFKNSAVMLKVEAYRPKLFYTCGPRAGEPQSFPSSDDPIRVARSAANVHSVGLFPSFKPIFKITRARSPATNQALPPLPLPLPTKI